MAEEEKRAYTRSLPKSRSKSWRATSEEAARAVSNPIPKPIQPAQNETVDQARARLVQDYISTGDDPNATVAPTQAHQVVAAFDPTTGKHADNYSHYGFIPHSALPQRTPSETHENRERKLGKSGAGAVYSRALSLPGTIVSEHGIHYNGREFHQHWGYPVMDVVRAVDKTGSIKPPSDIERARVEDSILSSAQSQYQSSDWQDTYGTGSASDWQDTDGTATGDAQ